MTRRRKHGRDNLTFTRIGRVPAGDTGGDEDFEVTKGFPMEERCSLTDQVRRSFRSVCANLAGAWRKRHYSTAFVSKLNNAKAEAAETQVWLEMALRCSYLKPEKSKLFDQ